VNGAGRFASGGAVLVLLVVLNAVLWTMTGFGLCWATHRQRGLEADRLDIVWPDTVPDWLADSFDDERSTQP
jgi:hypothetical protein